MYAKESKCDLEIIELLYLGHIISAEGVPMDSHYFLLTTTRDPYTIKRVDWSMSILSQVCQWLVKACNNYDRFTKESGMIVSM